MLSRFENLIVKHNMFKKGDSVVCGISGGSDSVCLLMLLCELRKKWNIKINAVHINHMIRSEADRDENFVRELCRENECSFYSEKFNIPKMSAEEKISSELCGRNVRYKFFEQIAKETGSCAILTAHNKNDNVETFMLHLVRGSSGTGLGGISYVRDNIKRPLLDFNKTEIENYLKEKNISWVEDKTNKEDIYTRNKIRNVIIPSLKEINPSVEDAILRCMALLREDDTFLCELAEKEDAICIEENSVSVDINVLNNVSASVGKRIVAKAIKSINAQLSEATVNAVYDLKNKQNGKKFIFPCNREAIVSYGKIILSNQAEKESFSYKISAGEEIYIREAGVYVSLTKEKPDKPFLRIGNRIQNFEVRNYLPGDKFIPAGMKGHKKVKDFFIDKKIPREERNKTPIFIAENTICAIGTIRSSEFAKPENENEVLYIKIKN